MAGNNGITFLSCLNVAINNFLRWEAWRRSQTINQNTWFSNTIHTLCNFEYFVVVVVALSSLCSNKFINVQCLIFWRQCIQISLALFVYLHNKFIDSHCLFALCFFLFFDNQIAAHRNTTFECETLCLYFPKCNQNWKKKFLVLSLLFRIYASNEVLMMGFLHDIFFFFQIYFRLLAFVSETHNGFWLL